MAPDGNGGRDPDPETVAELRRLARSGPRSGRQSVAKASAIRTLERLARERRRQPMLPMPDGWYPHDPDHPFYELDWVFLHKPPRFCGAIGSWRGARGVLEATDLAPHAHGFEGSFANFEASHTSPR